MNDRVTFGLPKEWKHFKERHSVFLDRIPNLFSAIRIAFDRTGETSEPLDRAIFFSGRLCAEEFSEILLLCGNGYGVAALRLVRSMYEHSGLFSGAKAVSCGQAHSSARELVAQGKEAKLVAETLEISRSSLYCQGHETHREPILPAEYSLNIVSQVEIGLTL